MITDQQKRVRDAFLRAGTIRGAARELGLHHSTVQEHLKAIAESGETTPDYDINRPDKSPAEAWQEHAAAFERKISKARRNSDNIIKRGRGAFVIFHSTDEHIDDDATPLNLIAQDIAASHALDAIMCHGGDLLNNWPMAGKLAKQWAMQECTAPSALLRMEHFISIFKPNVWTDGNHEEMNPYLDALIERSLPSNVIRDYWTVRWRVETPDGRPIRCVMSHKFQKGSSWFHKAHGHIREMLESEEADVLMDGHLHSDGVLDHTLPERGHSALCVASAGYKLLDKYAARISRGGKVPKVRGRAHWLVCDPYADHDENLVTAFKSARQAEAMLNGLQNLRAA